jgi:hypothetical protein
MKKITIKILFIIVLALPAMTVAMANQTGSQARETAGLYSSQASREAVQESSEKVGLYKDLKDFEDLKDFKKESDDDSGDLRAGGNMGGGDSNKVPIGEGLPLLFAGAILYASFLLFSLFLSPEKKKFLKLFIRS